MAKTTDSFAYFTFVFIGVCVLLSWNVILSSLDLFNAQVNNFIRNKINIKNKLLFYYRKKIIDQILFFR